MVLERQIIKSIGIQIIQYYSRLFKDILPGGSRNKNEENYYLGVNIWIIALGVIISFFHISTSILIVVILHWVELLFLNLLLKVIARNQTFLKKFDWEEFENKTSKILQFFKFSKMIAFGYQYRSNTNMILHEQAINPQLNSKLKIENDELQLQRLFTHIYCSLHRLSQQLESFLKQQDEQTRQKLIELVQPYSFRNIFQLNNKLKNIVKHIQDHLSTEMRYYLNPFTTIFQIYRCSHFIQKQVIKKLQIAKTNMLYIQKKIEFSIVQSQKQPIFKYLIQEDKLQQLEEILNNFQSNIKSEKQKQQEKPVNIFTINQQSDSLNQKCKSQEEVSNEKLDYTQKKRFMAKLDALLVMGLARKKQKQYQEQSLLEQQHSKSQ